MTQGILGIILAGGEGKRLGKTDKAFLQLGGKSLMANAIARLAPQLDQMAISANGPPERFESFDLPVLPDPLPDAGPLAGILAGMNWAAENAPEARFIATIAVDTPFFPDDFVSRLVKAIDNSGSEMARAVSNGRAHPVFGLWPVRLADELNEALVNKNLRKVGLWTSNHSCADVEFPADKNDPFFNINHPEDIAAAEKSLPGAKMIK